MSSHPCLPGARRRVIVALLAGGGCIGLARADLPGLRTVLTGRVVNVHDGDSFTLRSEDGRRWRIRIAGIDAPELAQPGGEAARLHLSALIQQTAVKLATVKVDAFDRTVAKVWVARTDEPDTDVGLALIEAGLAWHFARYKADQVAEDVDRYARAQRQARSARRGLWQEPNPEPPWDYRSRMRRYESGSLRRAVS